ncbi:MAG: NmrA family NAD(P)-binding protein [Chloroflexi bacterium]|jgi:uncharacterized protein YbjT (DUF2867 family)|nr:NmrA family NAD(P)-binding protein [Anaerolineaceae bacterium]NMB88388.1 NmrA family NAD(P)-binding protein [Chloroflexota bacterium]
MILVTGGTGFIGKVLIRQLVELGRPVRTLLRPSSYSPNLPRGIPVEAAVCSLRDERGLLAAMKDVDVIFHLAGGERLGARSDLTTVDVEGTQAIARAAVQAGVERMFYVSHLGADRASAYAVLKAKAIAEGHIVNSGIPYTIFRSAAVFGMGDRFTVPLARMLHRAPGVFFLPAGGETRIQPIWVEDLVTCMVLAMDDPGTGNQLIEVGGEDYFTFRQVIEIIQAKIHTRRSLIPLSPAYLRILSLFIEQSFPEFPISIFWLDYLAADRTCALDTLPRRFGLLPARFAQRLDYLQQPFNYPYQKRGK